MYTVYTDLYFIPILISTGASSDVEVATKIARAMVTKYAMSEEVSVCVWPAKDAVQCVYSSVPCPVQLGPLRIGDDDKLSPETSLLVEEEIKKLLKVIPQLTPRHTPDLCLLCLGGGGAALVHNLQAICHLKALHPVILCILSMSLAS